MWKAKITNSQIDRLADIFSDLGILFVASAVLPAILGNFDVSLFMKGASSALIAWIISLKFSK